MIEFGAKLALKDNMIAVIQKNIQAQKKLTDQVNKSREALGKLSKGKHQIKVDGTSAQKEAQKISNKLRELSKAITSTVQVETSPAQDQIKKLLEKLKEVKSNPIYIKAEANVQAAKRRLVEIKEKLDVMKNKIVSPIIKLKDTASKKIQTIKKALSEIGNKVATPVIRAKDTATKIISGVVGKIKALGKRVASPIIKAKDTASKIIGSVKGKLSAIGSKIASPLIKAKDAASSVIKKLMGMLGTLAKGVTIGIAVAGAGAALAGKAMGQGAMLEQQQISIEHFVGVNNRDQSADQIKQMSQQYMEALRNNANATPFTTNEVIAAGTRAVNVASGNTQQAMSLLKVAEDMAALNPEKSLSDAMEAIADMKVGETERMKEFGFKISQEDIKNAGGVDNVIENQLKPYFEGGAQKLATSAAGLASTIQGKVSSIVSDTGLKMVEKVKPLLQTAIDFIDKSAPAIQAFTDKFANGFGKAVDVVNDLITGSGKMSGSFGKIGGLVSTASGLWKSNFNTLKTSFSNTVNSVQKHSELFGKIMGVISDVGSSKLRFLGSTFRAIGTVASSAFEGILSVAESVYNAFEPIISGIADAVTLLTGLVRI